MGNSTRIVMGPRRRVQRSGVLVFVCWCCLTGLTQAQEVRSMDYVFVKEGALQIAQKDLIAVADRDVTIGPAITVLTNGTVKVAGGKDFPLAPGRKLTLDGFWWNDDGMLVQFAPHYIFKNRVLYFVQEGQFQSVGQEVAFRNGVRLRPDATILTADQKLLRLQDGQGLTTSGQALPALDHIMMIKGKLVLQKDGSILGTPGGMMGMSDGTKVTPQGQVTLPNGTQILLKDGQRITLPGPAMSPVG